MTTLHNELHDKSSQNPPPEPPVEAQGKKKRWFVKYWSTLFMLVGWFVFLIYPGIVTWLVNGIPKAGELQTFEVRILQVYRDSPHLRVQMPDGAEKYMAFPVKPVSAKGGHRFYGMSDNDKAKLPGCRAIVRGVPIRWIIEDHFRVWELICAEKNVHLTPDRSIEYYLRTVVNNTFSKIAYGIGNLIIFSVVLIIFWSDRKGKS